MKSMGQSTFLIKSSKNKSFGTGFCIHKDKQGSFLLTCAHVVEDCGMDTVEVNGCAVELICIGSRYSIDLAVLYIENLKSIELNLIDIRVEDELPFYINGFRVHLNQNHKLEKVDGIVNKCSTLYSKEETVDRYELTINLDDSIQKGYSGSAITSSETEKVFAIATTRYNINHAEAIPIDYLFKIWEKPPTKFYKKIKKNNSLYLKYLDKKNSTSFFGRIFKSLFSKLLVLFRYIGVFLLLLMVLGVVIAISSTEEAKELNRKGEKAYFNDDIEVAISYYEKAIEENSGLAITYINLSEAYHSVQNNEKALSAAGNALRIAKEMEKEEESGSKELLAKSYFRLAIIYEEQSEWEQALENYNLALFSHRNIIYQKAINRMNQKLGNTKKE